MSHKFMLAQKSCRKRPATLNLKKCTKSVHHFHTLNFYFSFGVQGEFFQVFWMERRNPLSKIKSDQNFTCKIFENMSELIFDTGFHLSIQNNWKKLPLFHKFMLAQKSCRKQPAMLIFKKSTKQFLFDAVYFNMQGAGILCTLHQRWVAKLDKNGTQVAGTDTSYFYF